MDGIDVAIITDDAIVNVTTNARVNVTIPDVDATSYAIINAISINA